MAPLSLGGLFGAGNARSRTRESGRVQKQLQMCRPPFARGYLAGMLAGIFEKYFLLARRDPAKSIVETVLSQKQFFKNLDFSKIWDPGIWQSARQGPKWRPVYDYTPPLPPVDSSRAGRAQSRRVFRAISQSVPRGGRRVSLQAP